MPTMGLSPALLASWWNCTAPNIEPWSVSASAGMRSSAARSTMRAIVLAPSSIE